MPAPLVPIDLEEDDADARSHALMLNRREVQAEYEEEEPSRSWKLVTSQPGAAGKGTAAAAGTGGPPVGGARA